MMSGSTSIVEPSNFSRVWHCLIVHAPASSRASEPVCPVDIESQQYFASGSFVSIRLSQTSPLPYTPIS